jgi:hypothetical protein
MRYRRHAGCGSSVSNLLRAQFPPRTRLANDTSKTLSRQSGSREAPHHIHDEAGGFDEEGDLGSRQGAGDRPRR